MKAIGITGGIGSGKSYVCSIFKTMGYEVYDSDARAKALMAEDPALRQGIAELFGAEAYHADGALNRAHLAKAVFGNAALLAKLNALVHPAVARDTVAWQQKLETGGYDKPFALKEAAILFESGAHRGLDGVIVVSAPPEVRIARVMARDGRTREEVLQRMANQMPQQDLVKRADFIIENDGLADVPAQVHKAIHHFSRRFAEQ
jgi:dephospho-CoA kinase